MNNRGLLFSIMATANHFLSIKWCSWWAISIAQIFPLLHKLNIRNLSNPFKPCEWCCQLKISTSPLSRCFGWNIVTWSWQESWLYLDARVLSHLPLIKLSFVQSATQIHKRTEHRDILEQLRLTELSAVMKMFCLPCAIRQQSVTLVTENLKYD